MSSGPPLGVLFALAAMCALCSSSSAAAGGFALMGDSGSSGSSNNSRTPAGPAAGPTAPILPTARYVKLTFHDGTPGKYVLTPHEIKVLDAAGTNMALSGTISGVSTHHNETTAPRGAVIDGDETTLWHSAHGADTDFITIDLGADKVIAKIEIVNSTGTTVYNDVAANARMSGGGPTSTDKGAYVQLINSAGSVVKTTPDIKTVADRYTVNFNDATLTWK